ncbi:hypothetical protein GCM10009558_016280 [Virgisporangium aurantiacum]
MTSKRRNRIGRRSSRPLVNVTKGRVMATAAGLFVVAGTVGAAIWVLLGRRTDEPARPDTVPASEEQVNT